MTIREMPGHPRVRIADYDDPITHIKIPENRSETIYELHNDANPYGPPLCSVLGTGGSDRPELKLDHLTTDFDLRVVKRKARDSAESATVLDRQPLRVRANPKVRAWLDKAVVDHRSQVILHLEGAQKDVEYQVWKRPLTEGDYATAGADAIEVSVGPEGPIVRIARPDYGSDRRDAGVGEDLEKAGFARLDHGPPGADGVIPLGQAEEDLLLLIEARKTHRAGRLDDPQAQEYVSAVRLEAALALLVPLDAGIRACLDNPVADYGAEVTLHLEGTQKGVRYRVWSRAMVDSECGWRGGYDRIDVAIPGSSLPVMIVRPSSELTGKDFEASGFGLIAELPGSGGDVAISIGKAERDLLLLMEAGKSSGHGIADRGKTLRLVTTVQLRQALALLARPNSGIRAWLDRPVADYGAEVCLCLEGTQVGVSYTVLARPIGEGDYIAAGTNAIKIVTPDEDRKRANENGDIEVYVSRPPAEAVGSDWLKLGFHSLVRRVLGTGDVLRIPLGQAKNDLLLVVNVVRGFPNSPDAFFVQLRQPLVLLVRPDPGHDPGLIATMRAEIAEEWGIANKSDCLYQLWQGDKMIARQTALGQDFKGIGVRAGTEIKVLACRAKSGICAWLARPAYLYAQPKVFVGPIVGRLVGFSLHLEPGETYSYSVDNRPPRPVEAPQLIFDQKHCPMELRVTAVRYDDKHLPILRRLCLQVPRP